MSLPIRPMASGLTPMAVAPFQGSPSFVHHQFKDFLSTFLRQIFTVSETGLYTVSLRLQIHKCEKYHIIATQHSLQYMHTHYS